MPSTPSNENSKELIGLDFDEQGYNESEDEDFDPSKIQTDVSSKNKPKDISGNNDVDTEDDDEDVDEDYKAEIQAEERKYKNITSDEGGLIKTRRARQAEEEAAIANKYERLDIEKTSQHSNELWAQLKAQAYSRSRQNTSIMDEQSDSVASESQQEKILIERTYKFAGELISEKKWVPRSSAEGQEYLSSLKFKTAKTPPAQRKVQKDIPVVNEAGLTLKRHLKRPPILEQIISGALKPKLTTLEKSQLDWATYVDKEGLQDELHLHNKDGYLAKQDFLNRVETSKDEKYKELRKLQLQQEQQDH